MKTFLSLVAVCAMLVGGLAFATDHQQRVVQKQVVVERVVVPQKVVEFVEVPNYYVQQEKVVVRQFVQQPHVQKIVVERQVNNHHNVQRVQVQRSVQRSSSRGRLFGRR